MGIVAPRAEWGRGGRLKHAHVDALELGSLQELNGLPAPLREGLYGRLIPAEVCARFGVDPATGLNGAGHRLLRIFRANHAARILSEIPCLARLTTRAEQESAIQPEAPDHQCH